LENQRNVHIEVVRGAAAMLVFLCHLIGKLPQQIERSNHLISLFTNWGTEAVLIFFVLSGIVIHSSFERRPISQLCFLGNRITRLHPTLIFAVLISLFLDTLILDKKLSFTQIIGNLIPVSALDGNLTVLFSSNPVIWSLSFELFFYLIFALLINKSKLVKLVHMQLWFLFGLICIWLYYQDIQHYIIRYLIKMAAYSPIWLIGFFIWNIQKQIKFSEINALFSLLCLPLISRLHLTTEYFDPIKFLIFAVASIPFFSYLCQKGNTAPKKDSNSLFGISIIIYLFSASLLFFDDGYLRIIKYCYIFLPALSLNILLPVIRKILLVFYTNYIIPPFNYLGKVSYSLYLLHFPVLIFIYNVHNISISLKILLVVAVIGILTYQIDLILQPKIVKYLRKIFVT